MHEHDSDWALNRHSSADDYSTGGGDDFHRRAGLLTAFLSVFQRLWVLMC